jgi:hypothetical protein
MGGFSPPIFFGRLFLRFALFGNPGLIFTLQLLEFEWHH